ncbi:hypothetical protein RHMOL_Rhmol12G0239200 [Rhododendron molle]|uniref:Uncharacterized protein n=1 Tax=Rhododendron molle TaxID=49168 RepID=A0ACC0LLW8_RHOML|nr:hypothetical protein RHMOL_Rhmol12G0239200 [Rhododendron molle]
MLLLPNRYSADVDAAYRDMDASDEVATGMWRTLMWGEVHALIFFTERRNNGELVVSSSSPSSPSFSVILNNYGGFETGLGRRTATAVEHVRMVCGLEDGKNNGGGWRE